jgi:hypothetical protein
MAELTEREFWLITVYFKHHRGFHGSHRINDIVMEMLQLSCGDSERIIHALIEKNVLNLSPDKWQVKFTDYGLEMYTAMERAQADWEKQPIIKVSNIDRDQILIRAGETFRANRIVREILQEVRSELCLVDAYLGPEIFDLIEDTNPHLKARLLASDKAPKTLITSYKAFQNQYPTVGLRITDENKIHDRYMLWDGTRALHIGHSLMDLGKKDTQISVVKDPRPQFGLFDERWAKANEVA